MKTVTAYIALGSNLGDREKLIRSAIAALDALPQTKLAGISELVETAPVGQPGQGPYLNAAAAVRTSLGPRELLGAMLEIERAHGRDRSAAERWGPRLLDLDLLLHGDHIIDEPGLTVPHPEMHQRTFVLGPLSQIAPHAIHPVLRLSVQAMRDRAAAAEKLAHPCAMQRVSQELQG